MPKPRVVLIRKYGESMFQLLKGFGTGKNTLSVIWKNCPKLPSFPPTFFARVPAETPSRVIARALPGSWRVQAQEPRDVGVADGLCPVQGCLAAAVGCGFGASSQQHTGNPILSLEPQEKLQFLLFLWNYIKRFFCCFFGII